MINNKEDNMKYNTRPIDYTGCHPVIAEHLKRGEAIKCKVWDDYRDHEVVWVYLYEMGAKYPYRNITGTGWKDAEPIPIKTKRIMPPERAIPTLIAEGWSFNDGGNLVGCGINVLTGMFRLMGKPLSDPKASMYAWPSCIIEEVEDDE